jgi:hypothetical protein
MPEPEKDRLKAVLDAIAAQRNQAIKVRQELQQETKQDDGTVKPIPLNPVKSQTDD